MDNLAGGVEFVIFAALIGLLPAWIASRKGYSFAKWWLFGALLFLLALPLALLAPQNGAARRQCPHCRVWIDRQATVCRQCGRDVPEPQSVESTPMTRLIEEPSRIPSSPRPSASPADTKTLDTTTMMLALATLAVIIWVALWVF